MFNFACPVKSVFIFNRGSSSPAKNQRDKKAGTNFNHPSTICRTYGAGRHTLSISRIALKLHFVPKFEPNTEIGQKGAFYKGLEA